MTEHEQFVLTATHEYKSSCNGKDRYQMAAEAAMWSRKPFPTREQWNAAKQALIERGELTKAGAKRVTSRKLRVGDILECSWGYDQTNIDFYQVIALIGASSVSLCKMAWEDKGEDGFMTAEKTPTKPIGEPFTKKEQQLKDGKPYIKISSYAYAFPWDGKPSRYSWYA